MHMEYKHMDAELVELLRAPVAPRLEDDDEE